MLLMMRCGLNDGCFVGITARYCRCWESSCICLMINQRTVQVEDIGKGVCLCVQDYCFDALAMYQQDHCWRSTLITAWSVVHAGTSDLISAETACCHLLDGLFMHGCSFAGLASTKTPNSNCKSGYNQSRGTVHAVFELVA